MDIWDILGWDPTEAGLTPEQIRQKRIDKERAAGHMGPEEPVYIPGNGEPWQPPPPGTVLPGGSEILPGDTYQAKPPAPVVDAQGNKVAEGALGGRTQAQYNQAFAGGAPGGGGGGAAYAAGVEAKQKEAAKKALADRAKKIAMLYSKLTGQTLQPDIHLALALSKLPMEMIGKMLEFNPESVGMMKASDMQKASDIFAAQKGSRNEAGPQAPYTKAGWANKLAGENTGLVANVPGFGNAGPETTPQQQRLEDMGFDASGTPGNYQQYERSISDVGMTPEEETLRDYHKRNPQTGRPMMPREIENVWSHLGDPNWKKPPPSDNVGDFPMTPRSYEDYLRQGDEPGYEHLRFAPDEQAMIDAYRAPRTFLGKLSDILSEFHDINMEPDIALMGGRSNSLAARLIGMPPPEYDIRNTTFAFNYKNNPQITINNMIRSLVGLFESSSQGESPRMNPLPQPFEAALEGMGVSLHGRSTYDAILNVESMGDYRGSRTNPFGTGAVPWDLFVSWGNFDRSAANMRSGNSSSGRFGFPEGSKSSSYSAKNPNDPTSVYIPFGNSLNRKQQETISNTHIIPANPEIAAKLAQIAPGDQIQIKGITVDVMLPDGGILRTDVKNNNHQCEIIYVSDIEIVKKNAFVPTEKGKVYDFSAKQGLITEFPKVNPQAPAKQTTTNKPVAGFNLDQELYNKQREAARQMGQTPPPQMAPLPGVNPMPSQNVREQLRNNRPEDTQRTPGGEPYPAIYSRDLEGAKQFIAENPTTPMPDWVRQLMSTMPDYIATEAATDVTQMIPDQSHGGMEFTPLPSQQVKEQLASNTAAHTNYVPGADGKLHPYPSVSPANQTEPVIQDPGWNPSDPEIDANQKAASEMLTNVTSQLNTVNSNLAELEAGRQALVDAKAPPEAFKSIDVERQGQLDFKTQLEEIYPKLVDWQERPIESAQKAIVDKHVTDYQVGTVLTDIFGGGTSTNEISNNALGDQAAEMLTAQGRHISGGKEFMTNLNWVAPDMATIIAGVDRLKGTYDPNNPASKSDQIKKLTDYLSSFKDADGTPMFPVVANGRMDDPTILHSAAWLNYQRASLMAALKGENTPEGKQARDFMDSYMNWLKGLNEAQDPFVMDLLDKPSAAPGQPENNLDLPEHIRQMETTARADWANKLNHIIKEVVPKWKIDDPGRFDMVEAIKATGGADMLWTEQGKQAATMLMAEVMKFKNPNTTTSEVVWWWREHLGGESVPKEISDRYPTVSKISEIAQYIGKDLVNVARIPGMVKGVATDAADLVSNVAGGAVSKAKLPVSDALGDLKPFAVAAGIFGDILGDIAGKGKDVVSGSAAGYGKGLKAAGEEAFNVMEAAIEPIGIALLALEFRGMMASQEAIRTPDGKLIYKRHKDWGWTTSSLKDPFNGTQYDDSTQWGRIVGSMKDWKASWDEASRLHNDEGKGFFKFTMDWYGYPVNSEPILPFLADMALELREFQIFGIPVSFTKNKLFTPSMDYLAGKLPYVKAPAQLVADIPKGPVVTAEVPEIAKIATDEQLVARDAGKIYQVLPALRGEQYQPLVTELSYAGDTAEDIIKTVGDYAATHPEASDAMSIFTDSLAKHAIHQARQAISGSEIGNNVSPSIRRYLNPMPTSSGDLYYHGQRSAFDGVYEMAMSYGATDAEIEMYLSQLHQLIPMSTSAQKATKIVMDKILQDVALKAADKWYPEIADRETAVKAVWQYLRKNKEIEEEPGVIFLPGGSFVGGKKMASGVGVTAEERLTQAIRELKGPGGQPGPLVINDEIDDVAAQVENALDELRILDETFQTQIAAKASGNAIANTEKIGGELAAVPVTDASIPLGEYYRNILQSVYSQTQIPQTEEEVISFVRRVHDAERRLEEYRSFLFAEGINPTTDKAFLEGAATYQASIAAVRSSNWWREGLDLKAYAKDLGSEGAEEIQWAIAQRELMTKQHVPFFSWQMPTFDYIPIRPLTAFLKYGPDSYADKVLKSSTLDKAMGYWRKAVLFGLGTQLRMMSDEGSRLLDQGVPLEAILGKGKYAQELPWWVKDSSSNLQSFYKRFQPRLFSVMGGPGGEPYSKTAVNWLFGNLTNGSTGTIMKKWMAAERKEAGSGAEWLKKYALAQGKDARSVQGLPSLITPQATNETRLFELTNRVTANSQMKWAKEADRFFRTDLGVMEDGIVNKTITRMLANAKSSGKYKGQMSEKEFNDLLSSGSLPRVAVPEKFLADEGNWAKAKAIAESTGNALFKPLDLMTLGARGGLYRFGYEKKFSSLLDNAMGELSEVDRQLMHEAASRYATSYMEHQTYNGFRTAIEYQRRNLVPFGSAYRDYASYWSKAIARRPSRLLAMGWLQNKLTDKESVHPPDWLRGILEMAGMGDGENSLWDFYPSSMTFFTGGTSGYLPGLGPIVTLPVQYAREYNDTVNSIADQIPLLAFSDPGTAMFSKLNKLIYGMTGKLGHAYGAPFPLGQREESLNAKISDSLDYEIANWTMAHDGAIPSAEVINNEILPTARNTINKDFLLEFLGQYALPTGFSQQTESEQMSRAMSLWMKATKEEKPLWRDFLLGLGPVPTGGDATIRPLRGSMLKDNFDLYTIISALPSHKTPGEQWYSTNREDMLALHPQMAPFFVASSKKDGEGYTKMTPEEHAAAVVDQIKTVVHTQHQRAASAELSALEIWAKGVLEATGASEMPVNLKAPGSNLNYAQRKAQLKDQKGDYGKLQPEELATAALANAGGITPPDYTNQTITEEAKPAEMDKRQGELETLLNKNLAELPPDGKAALGMDTSPEALAFWTELEVADSSIKARMKKEQGDDVTFTYTVGKPYAKELAAKIEEIKSRNPKFVPDYELSQQPGWLQYQKAGFGLSDKETGGLWAKTYEILQNMTEALATATVTKDKLAIKAAAMQEIDDLKAQNEKYAKQIANVSKDTLKPTAAQLKAYKGDYSGSTGSTSTGKKFGGAKKTKKPKLAKAKKAKKLKKPTRRGKRPAARVSVRLKKGGGVPKTKKKFKVRKPSWRTR